MASFFGQKCPNHVVFERAVTSVLQKDRRVKIDSMSP